MIDDLTFSSGPQPKTSNTPLSLLDYAKWLEIMHPLIKDQKDDKNNRLVHPFSQPFKLHD